MKWIKNLEEFKTKNSEGEEVILEKGKVYEVEDSVADALVSLNKAEITKEPVGDIDLDGIIKTFGGKLESTVKSIFSEALTGVGDTLEKSIVHASPKGENYDLEKNWGWKDEEHFAKAVKNAANQSASKDELEKLNKAPTGHSVGEDASLGFLVPEPMSDRIWGNVEGEPFSLFALGDKYTTAGNSLKFNTMWETSRKEGAGQRNAGIQAYWEDEADEHTKSKMTVGKDQLDLFKVAVLTYATDETLEDVGGNFVSRVSPLAGNAIAYKINEAGFNGTGVGKPMGFMKSDGLVTVAATNNAGRNITHRNLNQMYWRNTNRHNAVWLIHPLLAEELEFIYFNDDVSTQRPVYLPANQIVDSPFGRIYNRPVVPFEFMNSAGDLGDLAFIDPSQIAWLTKPGRGIKRASSIHIRFLYDETAFKWTFRIGGKPTWKAPKEDLKGTLKRSPYVTLADRTAGGTSSGL